MLMGKVGEISKGSYREMQLQQQGEKEIQRVKQSWKNELEKNVQKRRFEAAKLGWDVKTRGLA